MKYKIINNDIADVLNKLYTKEDIEHTLDIQFEDNTDYIVFSKDYPNPNFIYSCLNINKKYFEKVPEYKPNEWNSFPNVLPPDFGFYIVYREYPESNNFAYDVEYWDNENNEFTNMGNEFIVAF